MTKTDSDKRRKPGSNMLGRKGEARRTILKSLGLGGIATAATALVRGEAQAAVPADDAAQAGYRETEHVATYYETTRF